MRTPTHLQDDDGCSFRPRTALGPGAAGDLLLRGQPGLPRRAPPPEGGPHCRPTEAQLGRLSVDCSRLAGSALEGSSLAGGGGREARAGPVVGMSRGSRVALGLSLLLTSATVAGVHLKQRLDQQVGAATGRPWRDPGPGAPRLRTLAGRGSPGAAAH